MSGSITKLIALFPFLNKFFESFILDICLNIQISNKEVAKMRKLLTLTALALSLGLSSLSFADSKVFGVDTPVTKQELRNNLKGSEVQKGLNDLYLYSTDKVEIGYQEVINHSSDDVNYIFGVKINV
jgi:hypothetical protein